MAWRGRVLPKPPREQSSNGAKRHPGIHGVASPSRGEGRALIGAPLTQSRSTVDSRDLAECRDTGSCTPPHTWAQPRLYAVGCHLWGGVTSEHQR
jgi:hypothetical protein